MTPNTLYLGDNLTVMRSFPDECVDLIYLDPPFNSKRDYNMVFRSDATPDNTAQVKAFADTWSFEGGSDAYFELAHLGEPVSCILQGLRDAFGETALLGYLSVMALRLREMHRLLKPTGSLYLHCDPTASHYLKVVLDALFGPDRFVDEIVWQRSHPHGNVSRSYGGIHDVLLFYAKTRSYTWTQPHVPYLLPDGSPNPTLAQSVLSQYALVDEASGRRFQATSLLNPNSDRPNLTYEFHGHTRVWRWTKERMEHAEREGRIYFPRGGSGVPREKRYLDEQEGLPMQDLWTDVPAIGAQAAERLGYPTQKPLALLERIISASSNPGDLVLDPFCGCGTAVAAAQKLGRKWVGIDITPLAISLIRKRMFEHFPDAFPDPKSITVEGLPVDVAGAQMLADQDRYAFENWALQLVGAAPAAKKKGADRGIDGEFTWVDGKGDVQRCIISVKSGNTSVAHVRDLVGTVQRERAAMGLLVTLHQPTGPMLNEAAGAGRYRPEGLNTEKEFQRIQVVTIESLLDGPGPDLPRWRENPYKTARAIETVDQAGFDFEGQG